jgi:hypothetical protein
MIIENYRKMRREGKINNAWASVHHLFIVSFVFYGAKGEKRESRSKLWRYSSQTGVTFLNAFWRASKANIFGRPTLVDAMMTIQACASVLEGLAGERKDSFSLRSPL